MDDARILLIGMGPHAKRIYYRIGRRDGNTFGFRIPHIVDIEAKRSDIEAFLTAEGDGDTCVTYVPELSGEDADLTPDTAAILDRIVADERITAVIISTDPASHAAYARWALTRRLSICMDKPVSARRGCSVDPAVPPKLLADYRSLRTMYLTAKRDRPDLFFSLMAQRRFHPAFHRIRMLLTDVYRRTGCPVTSVQSFHGDGQWRLPHEWRDLPYHGYTDGYGKCSHSGYHFFDILAWLLESTEDGDKTIDTAEIFVHAVRPTDLLTQMTQNDYRKVFPGQDALAPYDEPTLRANAATYGEVDAFCSFAFRHGGDTLSLASVNLAHNTFSQRGWFSSAGRDLYKGNGRLRHETHIIEQGPFQSIVFESFQSQQVDPDKKDGIYQPGGEYHLDLHIFRNNTLFPDWSAYEKIGIADLLPQALDGHSRGHQEDARRQAVLEFVSVLHGKHIEPLSDFTDHLRSITLMSGAYQSMANRYTGGNPVVTMPFAKT